jgi:hypothetical protein
MDMTQVDSQFLRIKVEVGKLRRGSGDSSDTKFFCQIRIHNFLRIWIRILGANIFYSKLFRYLNRKSTVLVHLALVPVKHTNVVYPNPKESVRFGLIRI